MRLINALVLIVIFVFLAACISNSADEKPVTEQNQNTNNENASIKTEIASTEVAIIAAVANADATSGEVLFNQVNQTGFACSSCHNVTSADRLIGPGLFGIVSQNLALSQSIEVYLWESIVNPSAFVPETYVDRVMPAVYQDIFTEDEIYQLVAYVMSLGN